MLKRRGSLILAALLLPGIAACTNESPQPTVTTSQAASPSPEPTEAPKAGDTKATISHDGKVRNYTVHAPPGYDGSKPLPVVFVLHFYPGTGGEVAQTSAMNAKADKENFLAVYPEGFVAAYNALVCCGSEDDVGFIGAVAERMKTVWKADPKRFYSTGISNGGDMSMRLAVELPGVFAAVAPVSGGFIGAKSEDAKFKPTTPTSVITFIGEQDRYFSAFSSGIEHWQKYNGCKAGKPVAVGKVANRTEAKCADGSVVVAYRIPAMGHQWPGPQNGPLTNSGIALNATDLIWDFFKAHPRP